MKYGSITTGIIADGLVFNMDAANRASYPKTGTTVTDTIDYDVNTNNTGTFSNNNSSTFFSTDKGGIFLFDGIDDHITVNGSTNSGLNRPGITNQITLEAWCYTRTFNNNYERIIARRIVNTPLPYMFGFHTVSGNKYDLYLSGNSSYGPASLNSTTNVILNEWVHFVGTSDNSTNFLIGGDSINSAGKLNGKIGNFQIYNRALSATEILHNYNALKGRFGL